LPTICGRLPSLIAAFPAAVGIWTFMSIRMSGLLRRSHPPAAGADHSLGGDW
jgi:hypothetical protein